MNSILTFIGSFLTGGGVVTEVVKAGSAFLKGKVENKRVAIEVGSIPNPLIYMKFEDTAALGTNSGTGGDFTITGTVTAGADVNP
tara:strand:+ start:222 stop:476 length:255 start_codon:yes stop_codon:yes gene_type:complete